MPFQLKLIIVGENYALASSLIPKQLAKASGTAPRQVLTTEAMTLFALLAFIVRDFLRNVTKTT
jgi:hypothetical protein